MALGFVVDLFDDLRHQRIRPAQALGIHQRPESVFLADMLVSILQKLVQHPLPNLPALVVLRNAEI